MADMPAVAIRLARQLIQELPPPLKPLSDSYPQWVCSLPGLNRCLQLWYASLPSGRPEDRCYSVLEGGRE